MWMSSRASCRDGRTRRGPLPARFPQACAGNGCSRPRLPEQPWSRRTSRAVSLSKYAPRSCRTSRDASWIFSQSFSRRKFRPTPTPPIRLECAHLFIQASLGLLKRIVRRNGSAVPLPLFARKVPGGVPNGMFSASSFIRNTFFPASHCECIGKRRVRDGEKGQSTRVSRSA